jgi:hypothetical protein
VLQRFATVPFPQQLQSQRALLICRVNYWILEALRRIEIILCVALVSSPKENQGKSVGTREQRSDRESDPGLYDFLLDAEAGAEAMSGDSAASTKGTTTIWCRQLRNNQKEQSKERNSNQTGMSQCRMESHKAFTHRNSGAPKIAGKVSFD